jgi:V8-like Glu-specific endopeptidase
MKTLLIAALFAAALTPAARANTFNGDNRTKFEGGTRPLGAVGRLDLPHFEICTATLVSRDLIVTAAHCLSAHDSGIPSPATLARGEYVFSPGYVDDHATVSSRIVEVVRFGSNTPGRDRAGDWAIARLAEPLGDQTGWFTIDTVYLPHHLNEPSMNLIGYGMDFAQGDSASFATGCLVAGVDDDANWLHNCGSSIGSSGGPIFQFGADAQGQPQLRLVGVQSAERRTAPDTLIGVPFSLAVANIAVPSSRFYDVWKALIGLK